MSSEDESYTLWCIVEGHNIPFHITASSTTFIAGLKQAIKAETSEFLRGVDAPSLTLWKPLDVILLDPDETLAEHIGDLGRDFSQFAEGLDPVDSVARVFQNSNQDSRNPQLDIIAQAPVQNDDQPPAKRRRTSDSDPFDEGSTVPGSTSDVFLNTPSKPLKDVQNVINSILGRYRSTMQELVLKAGQEPLLPLWSPNMGSDGFRNHIKKLGIPDVDGMPSLLLHDLGCDASITSQKQDKHIIADIFSSKNHIVLINTHGSGKTRLGLHGLCQNWGFYGVVQETDDGIGSKDFGKLMSNLDTSLDYARAHATGSLNVQAAKHMSQKVKRRVFQFILARFLLLNLLINEARQSKGGLRSSDHRHLWVLLQVRPIDMLNNDPFVELSEALNISSLSDLEMQIKEEYSKLECILEEVIDPANNSRIRLPLYCFIDKIQGTTTARMGDYRSDDKDKPQERPLLRPIWKSLNEILNPKQMRLILSGTAINEKSLQSVLHSTVFKIRSYKIKKDIGAFDDPDVQKQYIEYYLPLLDNRQEARQEFLKRAWGWCRGRYRSTATLIALIMTMGPNSPHKILNKFVESSTNFLPTDGEHWCANEPNVVNFDMEDVGGWEFNHLNPRQINLLCDILYGQIVYGSYSLKPFAPKDDIKNFIEYGFARTKREHETNGEHVIDEPLAIMAISNWLEKGSHFSLLDCLHRSIGKHAPRENVFEAYLAFYFRKAFEKTPKLNDIFSFRRDFARRGNSDLSWQREHFELVTVSIPVDKNERKISPVTPSRGPSSNVGTRANTDDDVLNWISENKESYPFCFPTESAGPDIFFYVRSTETRRLLLVALQAKYYQNIDKETLIQGVRTVTPPFFWNAKGKKAGGVDNCPSDIASRSQNALKKIENCIVIPNARYPVLRVFASSPADAKLERTLDVKESEGGKATNSRAKVDEDGVDSIDPDEHPLATLHLDNFKNISYELSDSWFHHGAEHAVVFSAKDQYDNELRRSKRQARLAGTVA